MFEKWITIFMNLPIWFVWDIIKDYIVLIKCPNKLNGSIKTAEINKLIKIVLKVIVWSHWRFMLLRMLLYTKFNAHFVCCFTVGSIQKRRKSLRVNARSPPLCGRFKCGMECLGEWWKFWEGARDGSSPLLKFVKYQNPTPCFCRWGGFLEKQKHTVELNWDSR